MIVSDIATAVSVQTKKSDQKRPLSPQMRLVLKVIGAILVPIGVAGVILPVLPGVPVLILAAACFARSSPRLEHWLVTHPQLGPGIVAWRERGAISLQSKLLAFTMMTISASVIVFSGAHIVLKGLCLTGMAGAALFIGTRPNQ